MDSAREGTMMRDSGINEDLDLESKI